MHLLLRRTQRDDGWIWSSMTFCLYAQLDLDEEEKALFELYDLGDTLVYDSAQREDYYKKAHESFDNAEKPFNQKEEFADEMFRMIGDYISGFRYAILTRLQLQISLGSLIEGQHVESNDLEEIVAVSDVLKKAANYLAHYLETALTFDGSEELDEY